MSITPKSRFNWPIVGHRGIVKYLKHCLEAGNIAQAYLFAGPAHLGKRFLAEILVNSLVCKSFHKKDGELVPCGVCECCRQLKNQVHPDVYWLKREVSEKSEKRKKNIGIDQIRELQNKLNLCSFLNSFKIAVIDEAETLSQDAANSLLKTLEEPTKNTVIILLAENTAFLPKTIVSRCQTLKFLPAANQEIFDHLLTLKVERKKAKLLAALAAGRPGLALTYLNSPQTYLTFEDEVKQFLTFLRGNIAGRFKLAGGLADAEAAKAILAVWRRVLRDLLLIKAGAPQAVSNLNLSAELEEIARDFSGQKLMRILAALEASQKYLTGNVNPKLVLENLALIF